MPKGPKHPWRSNRAQIVSQIQLAPKSWAGRYCVNLEILVLGIQVRKESSQELAVQVSRERTAHMVNVPV